MQLLKEYNKNHSTFIFKNHLIDIISKENNYISFEVSKEGLKILSLCESDTFEQSIKDTKRIANLLY